MSIVTIDPSTGSVLERFDYQSSADIGHVLDAAVTTQRQWAARPPAERAALLRRIAEQLRSERETLAATAVREMGKPIVQARAEIEKCAWCCEYFAGHAAEMLADLQAPSNALRSYVAYRPLGLLLAIMPWNFPFWQVTRALAPALLTGNAVILKHAAQTTRCGLEFIRIVRQAGAPDGLFEAIRLSDEDADALVADARIAAVTLTGSTRAGCAVGAAAGTSLKKCVLELGGSDAFIVLPDADIGRAAAVACDARFQNNGQSCIAAKRFIVESSCYDEFIERFEAGARALVLGEPLYDATTLGPLASAHGLKLLHDQVRATLDAGARLVCGGRTVERAGNFYEPTLIADVRPGMPLFDEETFGPVAAIVRAAGADDALALANHSHYGLGGSIWTRDIEHAEAMAARMECGMVFINGMVASDPRLPFGGIKQSGFGRELSSFGLHEFVNVQTVSVSAR
ncbi:MAG: NAD-dependent succinate-semialdehyde dehydrogenase [Bacillati bacterium]